MKNRSNSWNRLFAAVIGLIVCTSAASAQVTVENSAFNYDSDSGGGTNTLSAFTVGAGSNGKLVVAINSENANNITSITYGGDALTKIADSGTTRIAEIWYLDDPDAGTADVVAIFSGNARSRMGALSLKNAKAGYSVANDAAGAGVTNITLTTTASNTFVVGCYTENNGAPAITSGPFANTLYAGDGGSCKTDAGYQNEVAPGLKDYVWDAAALGGGGIAVAGFEYEAATAGSDIKVVASASNYDNNTGTSQNTISGFEVESGSNRKLIVTVNAEDTDTVTNVTYGGVAFTKAVDTGSTRVSDIWYLDNPAVGTADVVASFSGPARSALTVMSVENAASGVSVVNFETGTGAHTNSITLANVGELVVGAYTENGAAALTGPFANEVYMGASGSSTCQVGYQKEATAGTKTYVWGANESSGGSSVASFIGVEEPAGPPTVPISVVNTTNLFPTVNSNVYTIADFEVGGTLGSKLAVAIAFENNAIAVTNVTYGGVALSKVASNTDGHRVLSVWYLDDPAAGTADVVVQLDAAVDLGISVIHMLGAQPGVSISEAVYFGDVIAYTNEVTTVASDTLVFGVVGNNNTTIPEYSWTTLTGSGNTGSSYARFGYLNVSAPGTVSLTWANGVSKPTAIVYAGFAALESLDTEDIIEVPQFDTAPTIDGTVGAAEWSGAATVDLSYPSILYLPNIGGLKYDAPTAADLSATLYYSWDTNYLYFAIDVTDEFFFGPTGAGYPDDHILWGMDQTATNTDWDATYSVELGVNDSNVAYQDVLKSGLGSITTAGSTFAGSTNAGGWSYEVALKWTDLMNDGGFVPAISNMFGTHVLLCDNDGSGRETFLYSAGRGDDQTASTPSLWHDILLVEELPTPLNYAAWIGQYTGVGSQTNKLDDFDLDGLNHLMEYALGGNPEVDDAATVLATLVDGSGFSYVYDRRTDAAARKLTYTVERDTDLVNTPEGWTTSGITETTGPAAVGFEAVTNTVPTDVAERFLRLLIELAE